MDIEARQADVIEQFCILAKHARGLAAVELANQATAHPNLFAFGELLDMPNIQDLENTEYKHGVKLLQIFAYGTWQDAKASSLFHSLSEMQKKKLKQLTVMSLAQSQKVIPYSLLMSQLDISNIRELEDLLISDCMYQDIVKGKLDQHKRCLEVQFSAGRDVKRENVDVLLSQLNDWLSTSQSLLGTIEGSISWAVESSEKHFAQKKETEVRVEEVLKVLKEEAQNSASAGDGFFGERAGERVTSRGLMIGGSRGEEERGGGEEERLRIARPKRR